MAYDVFGYWNAVVGPNAPLNDSCALPELQQGSAESSLDAWTKAKFPREKIVVGVPAYARSYYVVPAQALDDQDKLRLYPSIDKSRPPPLGDKWDTQDGEVDVCGIKNNHSGVLNFWAMVENGFLDQDGNAAKGIDYTFDNCSKTVSDQRRFWKLSIY
jgi:chitinase